jgi:hypothetical protein
MSFIILYAGHFLFVRLQDALYGDKLQAGEYGQSSGAATGGPGTDGGANRADAVKYIHKTEEISGLKQEINILEVDPGAAGIRIQPVLSHDILYGFELLSNMSARKNAYAAVTGGFFSRYGLPAGMVVINGELISAATGKYPVFVVENGKAAIKDMKSRITVEYAEKGTGRADSAAAGNTTSRNAPGEKAGNRIAAREGSLAVNCYNLPASSGAVAVYTPYYGRTNRASGPNITAIVENGTVTGTAFYGGEAEIPEKGMLVSFFDTEKYSVENIPLKVGDSVKLSHLPELDGKADAYECGCWLVREGKAVVPEKDAWIGVLTNRDPRTAIGVQADGTVVLLTVDGRQPGYSAGFTGQELAAYLLALGVTDAAMLDGGASAEMLLDGRLVSRPSFKGEERPLAGGILVLTAP